MIKELSKSVLRRLPGYLDYLKAMPEDAPVNISATSLAAALGMGEVQVRKDLALVSDGGRPKVGYNRQRLIRSGRPHCAVAVCFAGRFFRKKKQADK